MCKPFPAAVWLPKLASMMLVCGGLVWGRAAHAADMAPLTTAQQAIVQAIVQDAPPKKLYGLGSDLEGKHYMVGNEWHLDQYAPHIRELGGVYVGVGTDQSYLLIGMARPELALLTDYDEWVVDLHSVYRAFFEEAADRATFLNLWAQWATGRDVLQRRLGTSAAAFRARQVYGKYHGLVHLRLTRVATQFEQSKTPCFVTDDATYTWVRNCVTAGRVRALRADLLAKRGLASVAKAVRELGMTVRLMYTSNAESYWNYTQTFKNNIIGMPFDARSQYIRTIAVWEYNQDYIYTLQPAQNLVAWLSKPEVKQYRDFIAWVPPKRNEFPFRVTAPDPATYKPPRRQK